VKQKDFQFPTCSLAFPRASLPSICCRLPVRLRLEAEARLQG
jgi:hypothetical protein